eukprot:gene39054-47515_t
MAHTAPSPFLLKASEVFTQLERFESVLKTSYENFVGIHRLLPASMQSPHTRPFTPDERQKLANEVAAFVPICAQSIQDLHRMLDMQVDSESLSRQFDKAVISSLLQKLNRFTSYWDKMQRTQKAHQQSPFRALSRLYAHHITVPINEDILADATAPSSSSSGASKPVPALSPKNSGMVLNSPSSKPTAAATLDPSFSQRYIAEIATTKQLKEYNTVSEVQKAKLLEKTRYLQKQFSSDLLQSYHMEHTVQSLSHLVSEFSSMIETQSEVVQTIGEVAKEVTSEVKDTDEELLLTLERGQRQSFSFFTLLIVLSLLLLLLHLLTP